MWAVYKPNIVWIIFGTASGLGIAIAWPTTVPDMVSDLPPDIDIVEREDTIHAWYQLHEVFRRRCRIATTMGAILGLSVGYVVSLMAGWSHKKRHHLCGWIGATLGGEVVWLCLPTNPPVHGWGISISWPFLEFVLRSIINLGRATLLVTAVALINYRNRHRIVPSRKALLACVSVVFFLAALWARGQLLQDECNLERSEFTDHRLVFVQWMPNLVWLSLSISDVSDDGLQYLEGHRLRFLDLSRTGVSDAGLKHLQRLESLDSLDLSRTQISDVGLVNLKQVPDLVSLHLSNTKVTDAGLAHLTDIPDLQWLFLTDTGVSDAGLIYVKRLTKLRFLELNYTGVTDAGLAHLKELTDLDHLEIVGTEVSPEAVAKLQAALPGCYISDP